jgi:hypothetical protein
MIHFHKYNIIYIVSKIAAIYEIHCMQCTLSHDLKAIYTQMLHIKTPNNNIFEIVVAFVKV